MHSLAFHAPPNNAIAAGIRTSHDLPIPGEVVYLIGDDSYVRESIFTELTVCGITVRRFQSAGEYLSCTGHDSAGCIILDAQLLDTHGFDLLRRLTGDVGPPTIFISAHSDVQSGVRAIKAGAIDFLIHPVKTHELLSAVNEAFSRDRIVRRRRGEIANLKERYLRLTQREREVFALVVRGFLNKQVAAILIISQVTVQIHRSNAMRKMSARSFADLVCMAIELQVLEQGRAA